MVKRPQQRRPGRMRRISIWVTEATRTLWRALRGWCRPIPVAVLTGDRQRRRRLARELQVGMRQLRRTLGNVLPPNIAVIVQHVLIAERPLVGCYEIGQQADGSGYALVRLALEVNGQRLSTDALLAALAEACVGLATQTRGGSSVAVPVEWAPAGQDRCGSPSGADPLARHPNRRHTNSTQPAA
jgi:hypothetical protein